MRALRFEAFGAPSVLRLADVPDPAPRDGFAVVRVTGASINPSDVKNVAGAMEGTVLPRTPGRDFAGVVERGPAEWLGREVFGTGGDVGFTIDGSHAGIARAARLRFDGQARALQRSRGSEHRRDLTCRLARFDRLCRAAARRDGGDRRCRRRRRHRRRATRAVARSFVRRRRRRARAGSRIARRTFHRLLRKVRRAPHRCGARGHQRVRRKRDLRCGRRRHVRAGA